MTKHLYSLIALAVLAGPLSASFEPQLHFWTHWPAVGAALILSGAFYLFWDALVVHRGDWTFNPRFTGTFRLFGLPVGEYLFFIAVPYACLFLFEVVRTFAGSTVWWMAEPVGLLMTALAFIAGAWFFRRKNYTVLAFASVAVFLAVLALTRPELAGRSEFWIWFALCFVAFIIVDGAYTALPTIWYNPRAITGIRIGPIPIEDFFYNFSYLGLTLCFYLLFESWFDTTGT
jgi:lycopene cyclase domain-containing protein